MPASRANLSTLTKSPGTAVSASRRASWLLPALIAAGFGLLFALLFRDRLLPAAKVQVVSAMALEEAAPAGGVRAAPTGKMLFQASGWIEPDPLPVKVTALTDGVIDTVHVLEGQSVNQGDLLVQLIEIDARLERDAKARARAQKQAAFEAHCTGVQGLLHQLEAEKARLRSDEINVAEALDRLQRVERMTADVISQERRREAKFDHERGVAAVAARQARIAELGETMNRLAYETAAMQAEVEMAKIELSQAELALGRTRITAPVDGRVLRLLAVPGQKKMLAMDMEDSATVAILYDPQHLQVRVDVPLADAAGLQVGQAVKIHCNLLPERTFHGEVTRLTGEADLQRNTLQAKVSLRDPDPALRPEMLCRVEFLETTSGASSVTSSAALSVYVPQHALRENTLWVVDPGNRRAVRRAVTASAQVRDSYRRIDQGLRPGEWVILDPSGLREGQRINPQWQSHPSLTAP